MPRVFTPQDGHLVMNLLVKQATGQQSITVVDSSSFASAGELVLSTGMENVLNSISLVLNNLIIASRPYSAKMRIVNAKEVGVYSNLVRKISFYAKDAQADGSHNTNLFTNLAAGFTAGENPDAQGTAQSTKSQWEQNPPMPLEMHFGGSTVWQDSTTMYEDQIKFALRNDAEWASFLTGYMQEHANDIESQIEAFSRLVLLNRIGMAYDMSAYSNGSAKDLTAAFNTFYGTSYTGPQLRSTYLKEFLAFMVSEIKADSNFMTERSVNYHWPVPKTVGNTTRYILRHTPKNRQKLALFAPLFDKAEALVLPEIFRPEYLSIENYEGVTYWQSENSRAAINVIPAITDADTSSSTYGRQIAGAPVALDYVVGCLFDDESCLAEMQLEVAETTPLEARKRYRNVWNTYAKNMISDPTEKFILYYMS